MTFLPPIKNRCSHEEEVLLPMITAIGSVCHDE